MSSCSLVLTDRDNDLNIYDFGNNPAGIVEDQKVMWMAARSCYNFYNGNFRRDYDPESLFQFHIQAEGVKPITNKSTFRGFIRYYNEELINVPRALEYEPYHDIFATIDTTTGTFDYYGPIAGLQYGHQLTTWATLGASFNYRLHDGLKRINSKTKIDGRMIDLGFGANFRLHSRLRVGLSFKPSSILYRLNANDAYLVDNPIIYRMVGDSLLIKNETVSSFNRKVRGEGYVADGQVVFHISRGITSATRGGYSLESRDIDENTSEGKKIIDDFGSWQKEGPFVETICRMNLDRLPLTLALSFGWESYNSWARTPRYHTIFEEMEGGWTKYGLGFAFQKVNSPLTLAIEYHFKNFNEEKHNYYQNYNWRRENQVGLCQFGSEIRLSEKLTARFGSAFGDEIAEYHLSLEPIKLMRFTIGTGISFNSFHVDLMGLYENRQPEINIDDIARKRLLVMVEFSQWE